MKQAGDNMKCYLCFYIILMCLISACNSTPPEVVPQPSATLPTLTKVPTATATRSPAPTATITETPQPTLTATAASSPAATPIILPTKQILMQFGIFGGDGGWPSDDYFGRDTPQWILYTDGQLLVHKSGKAGDWFAETTLTVPQMCSLLLRIQRTGFFQMQGDGSLSINDPIYHFDGTAQFSDGAPDYIIQVNGPQPRLINIYWDYTPYLTPRAKAAFNLFSKYKAAAEQIPYQAQYVLLWIQKGKGRLADAEPVPTAQAWPTDISSLESLSENNIQTSAYVDESYGLQVSQVLIQGKDAQRTLSLFDNHLTAKLFNTSHGEYYVIARPLLPHESPKGLSVYPYVAVKFDLPFTCSQ